MIQLFWMEIMSSDVKLQRKVRLKEQTRKIVKEITNFGVTESQKIDIMYLLAMNLENNSTMKEITQFLKKYIDRINNLEEDSSTTNTNIKKILT